MDTLRELPSDQLSGIDERNGTSARKSKKKKKKKKKKIGGSASVLQREYQIADSQRSSEDLGAPESNLATSSEVNSKLIPDNVVVAEISPEAGSMKSNAEKEKRRRHKANHRTDSEDHDINGQAPESKRHLFKQIDPPDSLLESTNGKQAKSREKRKHREKFQASGQYQEREAEERQVSIALEDTSVFSESKKRKKGKNLTPAAVAEDDIDQPLVNVEMTEQQETVPFMKKKDRRKKYRSSTSHSTSLGEEKNLQSVEPEDRVGLSFPEKKLKKHKKSKPGTIIALEIAASDDEVQDQDQDRYQLAPSIKESASSDSVDSYAADQFHLPKSNTGKRKKLQQSIEETAIQDPDTEIHVSEKPTLPQPKIKKYVAKPKTTKIKRTEAGDANSATLLNQFNSARRNSESKSRPIIPSAKALGKRPALDDPIEHQPKKKKQIGTDPRNGDIRSMFSDDALQRDGSIQAVSKMKQKSRLSALGVGAPSPAVKTSRSANEEMAGWTAADNSSIGIDQEFFDDESDSEENSGGASAARRKRYLPVDEPSLVAIETPKSGKKPNQKRSKSEESSIKKIIKDGSDGSSKVKPKRSRSQSATKSKDGKGRLDDDETRRIADALELYRVDNNLEQQAVNALIQGNAITDGKKLWDFMKEEVPDVRKRNLQSWCRRNFHNFAARGVWSAEQDEELMEVFNRMPKKWSLIGAELNRLPDDCRDRWRNYLCVTNLELGPWKLEEEHQLKDAVKKCIDLIREDRRRDGLLKPEQEDDDTYHEEDISWMRVSELMDLSRSHLQCYRKWKAIKAREHATTDDLVAERIVISNSWKHLKSYQDAGKTLAAEKLQFLHAVRESKSGIESRIDWRAIDAKLDRNHDAMEMRICLRGLLQNIKDHEKRPLQENVELLIKAYEESAPHEPEGYIDLPFESTGLKKRTKRSKTSSLFEDNPELYDVGGSSSKPKTRHRMRKRDETRGSCDSSSNADNGGPSQRIQVLDSAKKGKRAAPAKKSAKAFELSTEKVIDSDSDDYGGAPTSAQKPQSEDEGDRKPQFKAKTPSKIKGHQTARQENHEDGSGVEQFHQGKSDPNLEIEDLEMVDALVDSNDEGFSNKDIQSAYKYPPIDSDDDSDMQDADEPQVPATPEYELREGHSGMRNESADLDESNQFYGTDESENKNGQFQREDEEESLMDDMSDISANPGKRYASGAVADSGRKMSADLD